MTRSLEAPTLVASIDALLGSAVAEGAVLGHDVRRSATPHADVSVFLTPGAGRGEGARALHERLDGDPRVASVRRRGGRLTLRFDDAWLDEVARGLADGDPRALASTPIHAGQRWLVDFADPNATKALHVGHLRNIALGRAVVALLRATGARVITQSHVCDVGRNVCEAVAGYRAFGGGASPRDAGLKSDHFVGAHYARYLAACAGADADTSPTVDADAPIARELRPRGDAADAVWAAWRAGDPGVVATWRRVCDWALDGQARTLARLGVVFDRALRESGTLPLVEALVADGLARGVLVRTPEGAIAFRCGRPEFETLYLVRADGMPTQHLRGWIGVFLRVREIAATIDGYVHVSGDEWRPALPAYDALLDALGGDPVRGRRHVLHHGMVRLGGTKLTSSTGDALLVDTFLEQLENSPLVRALADESGARDVTPRALADLAVFGYFASRPAGRPVEFSWEAFLDERANPAWALARVAAGARAPGHARPDVADPDQRYLVLQAGALPRLVAQAAATRAPDLVGRYVLDLCRWVLERPAGPALAALARAHVDAAVHALALASGPGAAMHPIPGTSPVPTEEQIAEIRVRL